MSTGFCWGNLKENDLLEDLGIDGRIILKCIVKKSVARTWTRLIWLMTVEWRAVVNTVMKLWIP